MKKKKKKHSKVIGSGYLSLAERKKWQKMLLTDAESEKQRAKRSKRGGRRGAYSWDAYKLWLYEGTVTPEVEKC